MSFSTEVKEELIEIPPQCPHCNEALISALLRINGTLLFSGRGSVRLEVTTEVPFVARLITETLTNQYNLQVVITVRQNVLHKTPNWLIEVPYQKNLEEILKQLGILKKEGTLERGVSDEFKNSPCCFNSYVRGLFLGSGFVSDPKGNFHLEIKIDSEYLAEEVASQLQRSGIEGVPIPVRTTPRRNSIILYLKSGEHIATFMKALKATKTYETIQQARSTKNVRNAVNRQVNAEIANSNKIGAASQKQIATIRRVLSYYSFNNLPQALQEYVLLRVSNPEASMKELGELANPPLSKSAIYHRVKRFEEMEKGLPHRSHEDK